MKYVIKLSGSQITFLRKFKLKMKVWEDFIDIYLVIIDCVWQKCEKKCAQKRIGQYASRNESNGEFPKI